MLAMNFGDDSSSGGSFTDMLANVFAPVGQAVTQTDAQAVTGATALNQVASLPSQAQPASSSFVSTVGAFLGGLFKSAVSGALTTGAPTTPGATYPAGSITAFDPSMARWRVGIPGSAGLGVADMSGRCMTGACGALGAAYHEVISSMTQPPGVQVVDLNTFLTDVGQQPWYKNVWLWVGVGAVALVGVGTYTLVRRRRVEA